MKKILVTLLIGTSLLSGCSNSYDVVQVSNLYKEYNNAEYYENDLNENELKIIKSCLNDKLFKNIIKECGIKELEIYTGKYVNDDNDGYGDVYFIKCYYKDISLTGLHLLNNIDDEIEEIKELINTKLNGCYTIITIKDIKELK